ncbi:MAG: hypothetical protein U1E65_32910 [Myxococcota bacterium]
MLRYLLLFSALAGCADELPGTTPIEDQLHFPMGLAVAGDHLLVVNSDFDQRYNAGYVLALPLAELANKVSAAIPAGAAVVIDKTLPVAGRTRARIPSFGADVMVLGSAAPFDVFVASRGLGRVTRLTFDGTQVRCDTAGVAAAKAYDCSPAHILETHGVDAFGMAFLSTVGRAGLLGVAHLASTATTATVFSTLTMIDLAEWNERLAAEAAQTDTADPAHALYIAAEGLSGIVADPGANLFYGSIANGPIGAGSILPLHVLTSSRAEMQARVGGGDTLAAGTRGVVLSSDRKRAYVSIRIRVRDTTGQLSGPTIFNSGIAVIDTTSRVVLSVFEIGQELGKPTLIERNNIRTLYVPELRSSQLYALDVSADVPLLRHVIDGAFEQNGVRIHLLDTPYELVVAPAPINGRTLGFVSNFGNSSLAVLDLTDDDPRTHRLLGRIGRALTPDGTGEAP